MSQPATETDGRVLLVGADGMLGRAWEAFLVAQRIEHDAVARSRPAPHTLDLRDPRAIEHVVRRGYRWIVNCAAYTAVDAAEADEDGANCVNSEAVRHLTMSAAKHGPALVHYSTDYVFSGRAQTPYAVEDPVEPLNAYGRSKARGEAHVRGGSSRNLVIRTSWLYGPWGTNFVLTMRKLLLSKPRVSVVDDQRGKPTSIFSLVNATWALMQLRANGTYHVADAGECTWFDFAREIGRVLGSGCDIVPCASDHFPRLARRPAYSVLDTTRTQQAIGPLPDWRCALRDVLVGGRGSEAAADPGPGNTL